MKYSLFLIVMISSLIMFVIGCDNKKDIESYQHELESTRQQLKKVTNQLTEAQAQLDSIRNDVNLFKDSGQDFRIDMIQQLKWISSGSRSTIFATGIETDVIVNHLKNQIYSKDSELDEKNEIFTNLEKIPLSGYWTETGKPKAWFLNVIYKETVHIPLNTVEGLITKLTSELWIIPNQDTKLPEVYIKENGKFVKYISTGKVNYDENLWFKEPMTWADKLYESMVKKK